MEIESKQSALLSSLRRINGGRTLIAMSSALVLSACVANDNGGSSSSSNTPDSSSPAMSSSSAAVSSSSVMSNSSVAESSSSESMSSDLSSSSVSVSSEASSSSEQSSSVSSSDAPFQTLRIQAQDYNRDNFGENTPNAREATASGICADGGNELMDLEDTNDDNGICAIAYTDVGEYVEFTINVPEGGYDIALRNASDTGSSAAQQVSIDGMSIGSVQGAALGWTDSYATKTLYDVALAAGQHTLRVDFINAPSNLNYIEISKTNGAPSSSSSSSAPSGDGGVVGDTIEAETYNPAVSTVQAVNGPNFTKIGYFGAGAVACYDDIDLTGVSSISVSYARNGADMPTDGRFAILAGGPDPLTATNLGEKFTTTTGGWDTFAPLVVGLENHSIASTQLCFYGMESGGVADFDKFTLSAADGTNDGLTDFDLSNVPSGPAVEPVRVIDGQVTYGGVAKSIAGMSMFWSAPASGSDAFYNKETVDWLVSDWGIELVRAAMAIDDSKPGGVSVDALSGYLTNPFINEHALEEVVHAAIENGIYVIIDWHAHKAEDNKAQAIEFFSRMARKYGSYENVMYEIYNEPVGTTWSVIKPYAEDVIAAIRAEDPDNLIIVGTRTFSQRVDEVIGNEINDPNVAYTVHFYAGTHGSTERGYAERAVQAGLPIFVTEWGLTDASGDGSLANSGQLDPWLNFMRDNNISHANWAISSHGQTSAAIKQGRSTRGGWSDDDLTEGGKKIKEIIKNW